MVSEFYERKRRLALTIAVLSVTLLAVFLYLGLMVEVYSDPRAAAHPDGAYVIHRTRRAWDNETYSMLIWLDHSGRLQQRALLIGEARGLLAEGDEVTAVFGARASTLHRGQIVRGRDIPQNWEIEAAVHDAARGQSWIFGWADNQIKGRLLSPQLSEASSVAPSPRVERICAAAEGGNGPLVAWRPEGSTVVKAAFYDGSSFAPFDEWEIGAARHWDVALAGGRALVLHFHRDDHTFSRLRIRLSCCRRCGLPPPPGIVEFFDPVFSPGRRLTGLAAVAAGDRLLVVATRPTTVQMGSVPLPSLRQEGPGTMTPLGAEPFWRRLAGRMIPLLMLFFSFSLIFLGFTLLRERERFILEIMILPERKGPPCAEILQRAMAFILDMIILVPVLSALADVLNAVPETTRVDISDARWRWLLGLAFGLDFAYHFALEWAAGWTIGKKIIGIRVVRSDGTRLDFKGALMRNLIRPFDAQFPLGVFVGTAIMTVTRRRQRAGDLLAGTLVIQDRRAVRGPDEPRKAGPG